MAEALRGIILRAPEPRDVLARCALGVSAEIVRMYGGIADSQGELERQQADAWFDALAQHPHAWVIEAEGELAGEIRLDGLDRRDRRARLAIGLLHERYLGRGIGRRAVELALDHAFGLLGLHRVDLRVLSYNLRAIRCYQACGFIREGVERESALVGEAWHDDWIMAILEHEFRARRAGAGPA